MSLRKPWVFWGLLGTGLLAGGFWVVAALWSKPDGSDSGGGTEVPRLRFVEVQEKAGIRFHHFNSRRDSLLPEDVGSGVGWADYDNDGDEDLYLVNFAGPFLMDEAKLKRRAGNRLYRNDGNGKFTDVTRQAGVGHVGWDYACLWFDYDNDGWLDLAVTHYDGVILYRNRGDKTFEDKTRDAGLSDIHRFLLGLTAGDYDQDGDLDLYLCGYVAFDREKARNRPLVAGRPAVWTNPVSYPALPNILLRNEGNGSFTDATEPAGVANPEGKSMQALFCDFDNDGWPDLYVANDVGTADVLFHNRHGIFTDVSLPAGTFDRRASMGLAVGDIWHRGCMDLFTTHWVAEDHALWKNLTPEFQPNASQPGLTILFDDVGPSTGIVQAKASAHVAWGTGLYDFDNDGHLDLMLVNGSTIEDELTLEVLSNPTLIPQTSQVLWNSGGDRFVDVSAQSGEFFEKHLVNRGLAFADYDQDGRMDAAVLRHGGPAILLHNVTPKTGHWLQVRLKGTKGNVFGVGARIHVKAGTLMHTRQCVLSSSYLSSDSLLCHFGIGDVAKVDSVKVIWPGGAVSQLENVPADRIVTIKEPN